MSLDLLTGILCGFVVLLIMLSLLGRSLVRSLAKGVVAQSHWNTVPCALPPSGNAVLCYGHPTPFEDDLIHYLASCDDEGCWRCDVTGRRITTPRKWRALDVPA